MANHTPGPWSIFIPEAVESERPGIVSKDGDIVIWGDVEDDAGVYGNGRDEEMANARLIAAAPDLLDALEKFLEPYDGFSDVELWRRYQMVVLDHNTLTAIRKARAILRRCAA